MRYLTSAEIIRINKKIIMVHSPKEIIGVREFGALEMLVNAPAEALFGAELYPTIFDKAAILMINLATKHVFHNGNKRTAIAATHLFMKMNNYEAHWGFNEAIDFVMDTVKSHEKNISFEVLKNSVAKKTKEKYSKK